MPLFYEDPALLPSPLLFFNSVQPPSLFPISCNLQPYCSFLFLLLCFFGLISDCFTFDTPLNDIMDLEGSCCVLYVTKRQV